MKPWEAQIPKTNKNKDRKRCYTVWTRVLNRAWAGGKVVWLTDAQLTFAQIKYPNRTFQEVLERDTLEQYKKYIHQTVE